MLVSCRLTHLSHLLPSTKFTIFIHLSSKKVFKLFPLASSNVVDRVMKAVGDEWRHFRDISKLHVYILLAWRPHCFATLSLFVFCRGNILTTTETTVTWTRRISRRDSWYDVTSRSETQTLYCNDTWSISLGMTEAETLKLDLRVLKCQNPFFFS